MLLRGGIGALIALALAPLALDFGGALAPVLDQCRELLEQCILALQAAGVKLHWIPMGLLAGGTLYALMDRLHVQRKLDRLLALQRARPPHPEEPIASLAAESGVGGEVLILEDISPNPAFTAGMLRPRIFIAERLQRELSPAELRAVFRHEVSHLLRRDPLRFALLRFISKALLWLPLLRLWVDALMEEAEVIADDFAASSGGSDPLDVASALVALGRGRVPEGVAAIGGFRLLDRRVRRLMGLEAARSFQLPVGTAAPSLAALLVVWTTALAGASSTHADGRTSEGAVCPHAVHADEHCPRCERAHGPRYLCVR